MKRAKQFLPVRPTMGALLTMGVFTTGAMIGFPVMAAQGNAVAATQSAPRLLPPRAGPADSTLRLAVERFPELLDDNVVTPHVLAVLVGADGSIVDARVATGPGQFEMAMAQADLYQWLPIADGDGLSQLTFRKGDSVGGSRKLPADLTVLSTRLPPDFNPERSARRAANLMREQRPMLFLPSSSGAINRIVVLLAADGSILKEHVQLFNRQDIRPGPRDANHQQSFAETVAAALQISVNDIGVTGATTPSQDNGALFVVYAWQRGAGENGPRLYGTPPPPRSVDAAVALALLDQHLPDAFVATSSLNGTPTLLLSTQGDVLRAGRVPLSNGGLTQDAFESPVLGGTRIGHVISQTLVNASGTRRDVLFIWQADPTAAVMVRQ